jgi:transcriptional regulator with XRE-family HTH domain
MRLAEDSEATAARAAFGAALRQARKDQGLSQRALADLARLHQASISHVERGRVRGMRYRTLMRLLQALGVIAVTFEIERRGVYEDLFRYAREGHQRR